jgi:hypothetical protein
MKLYRAKIPFITQHYDYVTNEITKQYISVGQLFLLEGTYLLPRPGTLYGDIEDLYEEIDIKIKDK